MSSSLSSSQSQNFSVRQAIYHPESKNSQRLQTSLILVFLLVISILVQTQIPALFQAGNFKPNLVLIVALTWSLRARGWSWIPVALSAGALLDLFSVGRPGLGLIEVLITCFLMVSFTRPLLRDYRVLPLLVTVSGALVSPLIYYLLLVVFSSPPSLIQAWKSAIWPHFWQTALMAPVWLGVINLVFSSVPLSGEFRSR